MTMASSPVNMVLARTCSARVELSLGLDLPGFLCPALLLSAPIARRRTLRPHKTIPCVTRAPYRQFIHQEARTSQHGDKGWSVLGFPRLPHQCPGCGALSQVTEDLEPGFYSLSRRSVKEYLGTESRAFGARKASEDKIVEASMQNLDGQILHTLQANLSSTPLEVATPVCDRCHKLIHHHSGVSIQHPSIESIQSTILESPHRYNHIYHVIDAADFPMSLIPRIHTLLHLTPQRSLNRRSKTSRFYHGRKTEISFIITRSDLLAPLKSQVDSLMPYLVGVLRDALGSIGKNVRLGNVRCVSSKRGWWTKELKEDIWKRGHGGWMVGKVNVGKSQLFESVFPKGRRGTVKVANQLSIVAPIDHELQNDTEDENASHHGKHANIAPTISSIESFDSLSLLPPAPPEMDYPPMPLVSSLPGTTASPIRVSFGNGKGELIDLPGLSRGNLELQVKDSHRSSLVMRSRILPEQYVIKPGQSLLLGGFIRITPLTPDTIFLAYPFVPLTPHLTSTEKAISIQTHEQESGVTNISIPRTADKIASAGMFPLNWDVTKQRAGPVTERSAAGINVERLPYRVLSTDILIEGCGWVELVAQVRKRSQKIIKSSSMALASDDAESGLSMAEPQWPEVEVFSPEGSFIGARKPMGAWLLGGEKKSAKGMKGRPRQSMKGVKKKLKAARKADLL